MLKAPDGKKQETVARELLYKFRDLVYSRYGIHYSPLKLYLLSAKLEKMGGQVGNLWEFYEQVLQGKKNSVDLLLRTITVGHTFFFREESHFDLLVQDIRAKALTAPLIWCAASSTGEEPYSIAITLLERGIEDFSIVCSDVNPHVLGVMNRGVYGVGKFSNTEAPVIRRYFHQLSPDSYKIRTELRQYLKIKRLNLHDEIQFEEPFDYIFCRNVMIYFDDAGRQKVVNNLVQNLKGGGLLFLGHTEALLSPPSQLKKKGHSLFIKAG